MKKETAAIVLCNLQFFRTSSELSTGVLYCPPPLFLSFPPLFFCLTSFGMSQSIIILKTLTEASQQILFYHFFHNYQEQELAE